MEINSNILSSKEKTKPTNLKTMKKIIKKETTFTKLELPKEKTEEKLARYSKYRPPIQAPMITPKIEPMVLINPYHKPHQVKPKIIKAKTMSKIVIKGINYAAKRGKSGLIIFIFAPEKVSVIV